MTDLRFALRSLAKSRGYTAVALLTLAFGIGATTAIFSVVNAVVLRPLAGPRPQDLVAVRCVIPAVAREYPTLPVNARFYTEWRACPAFSELALLDYWNVTLNGSGDPVRLSGVRSSANLFATLGVAPALGRTFSPDEDTPGKPAVAILSDSLWRNRFNADPNVLGTAVQFDTDSYTAIGVLPPHALLQANLDFLSPATIRADAWKQSRDYNYVVSVIGRLKPEATIDQATAELRAAKLALNAQYPSFKQPWSVNAP